MSNSAPNLDFLDTVEADEVVDPTKNDAPIYKRTTDGFYAGPATFAEGGYKTGKNASGKDFAFVETYFILETPDADGNDAIGVSFSLPRALKPAGITFVRMGLKPQAIKNGLLKPTEKGIEKMLSGLGMIWIVQIPNAVKGRGGKRYPKQVVYSKAGWEGLCAQYSGVPTAEDLGVAPTEAVEDEEEVY